MRRKKLLSFLTLMLAAALVLAACIAPTPDLAQVTGVLIDASTGRPVIGATVQLRRITGVEAGYEVSTDKTPTAETTTDGTGVFLLKDVPPNRYSLSGAYWQEFTDGLQSTRLNIGVVIFDVPAGQIIDLGIVQNCPYTVCSWYPSPTPWWLPTPSPAGNRLRNRLY